jgi:predicted nuclease of predicted toxin-antitoxin system
MKLLANENIPAASILYLRTGGFDVLSVGADDPSITDREVMAIAIAEKRTIISFDRDYGELIFNQNYKPEHGVIYLRLEQFSPQEPGLIIERIVQQNEIDFERALSVIDRNSIRQRKY